ncbi:hypothetical protein [Terrisporobacter sp.]
MSIMEFLYRIPQEKYSRNQVSEEILLENIKRAKSIIEESEAVIIGGGSGLSSACGYNYYHNNEFFEENFSDFQQRYGFDNIFAGLNYVYSKPEEQWAFWANYINLIDRENAGKTYLQLKNILDKKSYFIITTNIDAQFSKVFPEEKIWNFQGDVRYFQCCQPCHDKIYANHEIVNKLVEQIENLMVPSDIIPRCPECGRIMTMWARDEGFLEGSKWIEGKKYYENFIKKYKDKKIVFLELGVGDMTPSIIKYPFWSMTKELKNAHLISVNISKVNAPEHIKEKTTIIPMEIGELFNIWSDI